MLGRVKLWFDAEGDFLEVQFADAPGYWANPKQRLAVIARMYRKRFVEDIPPRTSLETIRAMEGHRVRACYEREAARLGVEWKGRNYDQSSWDRADLLNRALSAANSCLYGICHAAILSAGYSPSIGFVHTGKQLSFVYDIADLYKTELTRWRRRSDRSRSDRSKWDRAQNGGESSSRAWA